MAWCLRGAGQVSGPARESPSLALTHNGIEQVKAL
jgi:hypothetical protein